jgi:tetratricopeptide (TPR) repeat protein
MAHALRFGAFALVLLVSLVAVGPTAPSAVQDITAAAQARAGYRYDRALTFYGAAAAADPADPRPHCLAGQVYVLQKLLPQAVAAFRRCTALAPSDPASWLALGDVLSAQANAPAALDAWRGSASAGSTDAWRRIALYDESRGSFADAVADWTNLPSSDLQALEHLGLIALQRGDTSTAATDFQLVRAQPSKYADELLDDGFVLLAIAPPTTADQFGRLGYTFLVAGMPSFALAPLRRAVALGAANGAAHSYLGWVLWVSGQRAAARTEIALGQRLAPKLAFASFAAGEVAASDGSAAHAIALFRQGTDLDSHNPVLWSELGRMYFVASDYVSAELADENAARLSSDPSYTVAYLHLYADYHFGLTTGRARFAATSALARWPDIAQVQLLAGEIFDLIGQPTDAFYAWQKALALDPTEPAPYVFLGHYAEDSGNLTTAALDFRTALALQPNGPDAARARALLAPIADIPV